MAGWVMVGRKSPSAGPGPARSTVKAAVSAAVPRPVTAIRAGWWNIVSGTTTASAAVPAQNRYGLVTPTGSAQPARAVVPQATSGRATAIHGRGP